MSLMRINHHPTRRQLATFGACWLLFFGCIGIAMLRRGDSWTTAVMVGAIAVVVPAIGWVLPRFMRLVYVGMAYLTFPIGFVVSHLILGVVYYFVVVPTGLLCDCSAMTRCTADSTPVRSRIGCREKRCRT